MSLKDDILKKANDAKAKNEKTLEQIPEKFHHYVQVLEKASKISKYVVKLDTELENAGCYIEEKDEKFKGTYLKIPNVYLTVPGKQAILVSWTEEKNYRFSIENDLIFQTPKPFIKSTVKVMDDKGNIIRSGNSTVPVNIGGRGVDATNPYENAETSAVGRALTFIGMGQTPDVASYEEVVAAEKAAKIILEEEVKTGEANKEAEGLLIDSVEFKDATQKAGYLTLIDNNGEFQKVAGWGQVWANLLKEEKAKPGNRLKIKTAPFTMTDKSQGTKLIEYEFVA